MRYTAVLLSVLSKDNPNDYLMVAVNGNLASPGTAYCQVTKDGAGYSIPITVVE